MHDDPCSTWLAFGISRFSDRSTRVESIRATLESLLSEYDNKGLLDEYRRPKRAFEVAARQRLVG